MNLFKNVKKLFQKPYTARPGVLPPSWIPYKDYIDIHPTTLIAPSATVQFYNLPTPPRKMLKIGSMSHIFGHFAFLREEASILIGDKCQIGSSHFISANSIVVEDDVLMAWGITVIDTDTHSTLWDNRKNDSTAAYHDYLKNPTNMNASKNWTDVKTIPVKIGAKSWVGFNATILKGVNLCEETIVGAESVITNSSHEKCTIVGNPAKKVTVTHG